METKLSVDLPRFSPSGLDNFMECPQQYDYYYEQLLKKKHVSSKYMDFGNYFHELSHVYYQALREGGKAGSNFYRTMIASRINRDLEKLCEGKDVQQLALYQPIIEIIGRVKVCIDRYIATQSPRIDAGISVVDVEHYVEAVVKTPKGRDVILHGYVDLIYRDRSGRLRIRDHKTGENKASWSEKKIPLLGQLLHYLVAYELETSYRAQTVEISYINSYNYKNPPKNSADYFGFYPHEHNDAAAENYKLNILTIIDLILDGVKYRRFNSNCSSCAYERLCYLELRGHSSAGERNTYYEKVKRDYERLTPLIVSLTGDSETSEVNTEGTEVSKKSDSFVLRWDGIRIGD